LVVVTPDRTAKSSGHLPEDFDVLIYGAIIPHMEEVKEEGDIEEEKRDYGREFEEEVRAFLEDTLRFSDVKGGSDFHIAPPGQSNQIDACGRKGNVLFVFECKASGRKVKRDLRKDILATATKAKIAFENYKNIPAYKYCRVFKFVFITKKIEVPAVHQDLCKEHHMFYEDNHLLEYYTELHEKIGEYATYNFLSDFGIYPPDEEELKVLAIKTKLGKYVAYNFFASPKQLLKFSYVARRRFGKEDFYQRMLDTSRIRKIQKFLDSGGIFPTNIILSLKNGERKFDPVNLTNQGDKEVGFLTISKSYSACWIIDGQHRLYSFARSNSKEFVSCTAFEGISIDKERGFFLEINREQKPIQPDLLWDLEGLSDPDSPRGIISSIVHTLNKDDKGPFFYKIYIPLYGSKTDKIVNMAAFCNGIENASLTKQITPNSLGMANPLAVGEPWTVTKRIAQVLARYFSLLQEDLSEDHKDFIFGNAGIPVMLYLLEPIVAHVRRIPASSDLSKYSILIADFFKEYYKTPAEIRKLRAENNSEGARKNLARQIGICIRRGIKDQAFWPAMEQDEFLDSIRAIERRIAGIVVSKLSQITTAWEKQRVPPTISSKIKERVESTGLPFEENLGLGDVAGIIFEAKNWGEVFQKVFIKRDGFLNRNELEVAFTRIGTVRNSIAHGKSVIHSKEDLDQCEIYLSRFSKVVPEVVTEGENA